MRLTNYLRDSFVRAVSNDVPKPVWPTRNEVQTLVCAAMPPEIKAIYDNEALRKALKTESYYKHDSYDHRGQVVVGAVSLEEILKPIYEQFNKRNKALENVRSVANSCSTLKQLQVALPELIDHMPSEDKPTTKNLPAVIGVVSSLKEAGFPKE